VAVLPRPPAGDMTTTWCGSFHNAGALPFHRLRGAVHAAWVLVFYCGRIDAAGSDLADEAMVQDAPVADRRPQHHQQRPTLCRGAESAREVMPVATRICSGMKHQHPR